MKKLRLTLALLAITATATFALVPGIAQTDDPCVYYQQYHKVGFGFQPVCGLYGQGWACTGQGTIGSICTYWKPNPMVEDYYPCRSGAYWTFCGNE